MRHLVWLTGGLLASASTTAYGQATLNLVATGNATVQPAGVRTGTNGLRFFNVQGSGSGTFASFGVVDFSPAATAGSDVTGLRLSLVQSNAAFTRSGPFSVYLTSNTASSIVAGTSTLRYQTGLNGTASVDASLTALRALGSFTFSAVSTGTTDTFDLLAGLDAAEESDLLAAIASGARLRLVLVPDDAATAATWAGQGNTAGAAPTLVVELDGGALSTPGPTPVARTIPQIQGAGHTSPDVGIRVRTRGVVTARGNFDAIGLTDGLGFFVQDAAGDGDLATSDAVFVLSTTSVAAGDEVEVFGTVEESGFAGEAPFTRIVAERVLVRSSGNPLPAPVRIGAGGRVPPTESIDDDAFRSFDPTTDGLDFFESLEAMRVTVQSPTVIAATDGFNELWVVVDGGIGATGLSARGTLNISPNDFNPERIQIDVGRRSSDAAGFRLLEAGTGARLADITGVVGYDFGNFQVQPEQQIGVVTPSGLAPEVTTLAKGRSALLVASYNVLNLDPNDRDGDTDLADGRFDAVARHIVSNLGAPDVVALQEIQDNSGSTDDGTVAGDLTLSTLVAAISAVGGPAYAFIDNTFITNNTSGGQPGANIRTAYLYDPTRVSVVPGSVRTVANTAAFAGSRLPLIATFQFGPEQITLVNNHFSSKGGSAPIFGLSQPFEARQEDVSVNGSLDERRTQATEVRRFVDGLLAANVDARIVVLGDLNDFEFASPVSTILGGALEVLANRLPENERYSYNFQGNSQFLDHILVSPYLSPKVGFDAVHVNSELPGTRARASDHDPLVVRIGFAPFIPECLGQVASVYVDHRTMTVVGGPLNGQPYRGVLFGTPGPDVIAGHWTDDLVYGLAGDDLVCGGPGNDRVLGGPGADRLFGKEGDDELVGGAGNDELQGGDGQDTCVGGGGRDRLSDCER